MTVAIIDYGSGNLRSVSRALERAARENDKEEEIIITDMADEAFSSDRIVLPGVGAFCDCRNGLENLDGMMDALEQFVLGRGRPFFGICVGMQLMAMRGYEHGEHSGFGWIEGEVRQIAPQSSKEDQELPLKIPHMGWNDLIIDQRSHPLLDGLNSGVHTYFVHSYAVTSTLPKHQLAHVDYGGPIVAAVGRDNIVGTQFHPEKSQAVGIKILQNFLLWQP